MLKVRGARRPLVLLAALLAVSGGTVVSGFASSALASPARAKMATLSVSITQTGSTVWGTVTATYKFQKRSFHSSHSSSTFSLKIPQGVTVKLSQTPTDATTWPFKEWDVKSGGSTKVITTASASVKMTGSVTVTAVYVVGGSSGSGNPYPYP